MKAIRTTMHIVEKIFNFISAILLIFIVVAILAQIVVRRMGGEIIWVDEMTRYAFIMLVLFGSVGIAQNGTHITITSFLEKMPVQVQKWVNVVIYLGVTAFSFFMVYAYIYATGNFEGVNFSVVTVIKMSDYYWLVSGSMGIIGVSSLCHVIDLIATPAGKIQEGESGL